MIRRQQLEARVIAAVDHVIAGGRVEDGSVECKAVWPDPGKRQVARQLAGQANRARGESILWLIGIDENLHQLTRPEPVDVASWWASVSKRFDGAVPDLTDLVVHVGEKQAVHALHFTTDLAPYVIKGGGEFEDLEREVPIRDGTRTRSARRDELLRLLIPAVAPPETQLLSSSVWMENISQSSSSPTDLHLRAWVFFEQPGTPNGIVTLPRHLMRARIEFATKELDPIILKLQYDDDRASSRSSRSSPRPSPLTSPAQEAPIVVATGPVVHGVERRRDVVVVTGPGDLVVRSHVRLERRLSLVELASTDMPVEVRLSFGVAGIDRRIQLQAQLALNTTTTRDSYCSWSLDVADDDPWATNEA